MSGRSSPANSLFSGYGSGKPVARELSGGMFGSVPGAIFLPTNRNVIGYLFGTTEYNY